MINLVPGNNVKQNSNLPRDFMPGIAVLKPQRQNNGLKNSELEVSLKEEVRYQSTLNIPPQSHPDI